MTKVEVDSFLSEAARFPFDYRLVIATTDEIGTNARHVLSDPGSRAGYLLRGELAGDLVTWPASIDELRAERGPCALPRPHQLEALAAIQEEMRDQTRGCVVMACGTGKTLVQLWSHECLAARCTLVTVPSLALLQQTLRSWTTHRTNDFKFLIVCSDRSIVDDDAVDRASLGAPVTTEPAAIRDFLSQAGARIVFATYHSTPEVARALAGTGQAFDLIIADEAHRLVGADTRSFATILRDELIPSERRLFFTATPRFVRSGASSGQAAEARSDVQVASMDDTTMFGRQIYRLTFGEAIRRGLLVDYRVLVVGVTNEQALQLGRSASLVKSDGEVWKAQDLATMLGTFSAMRDHGLRRVLSFHNRVRDASEFVRGLNRIALHQSCVQVPEGEGLYVHVSGNMPIGSRCRALNAFAEIEDDCHAVLANARCLSEGFDVPALDCVVFAAPRRSRVDIIQIVGRAIRRCEEKTIGTILVSVLVGDDEPPETVLEGSSYDAVWEVLSALRDHDDVLAETLNAARRKLARGEPICLDDLGTKITVDFPTKVGQEFFQAFASRVVERTTSAFEVGFEALQLYVQQHGHARPPTQLVDERGFPLGSWVSSTRTMYRREQLRQDRARRLEELPGWVWKIEEHAWSRGVEALRKYVELTGHARVPQAYVAPDGFSLGAWANRQRKRYRVNALTSLQIETLASLPRWAWAPHADGRDEGYARLLDFVDRYGHARVPQHYRCEDGFGLGRWMSGKRDSYARNRVLPDQIERLEALPGFAWNARDAAWDEGFGHLQRHLEAFGNSNPAATFRMGDYQLGRWVRDQRVSYQNNDLSEIRIARLESLEGWTWTTAHAQQWERAFALLEDYVALHGVAAVPKGEKCSDGFALGQWVLNQRRAQKRMELACDRAKRLAMLPGWRW